MRQEGDVTGWPISGRVFLGGLVVKNPPASAGNVGLIPGRGRSYILPNNYAPTPLLLSLYSRQTPGTATTEPMGLEPGLHTREATAVKSLHSREDPLRPHGQ